MVIQTPSGYSVTLKDYLSFGQRRDLQTVIYSKLKIKPSTTSQSAEVSEFSVDFVQQLQDKAFSMLVEKIIIDETEHTDNLYELVMNWKQEDGQAVFDAIDKITELFSGASDERKKK